MKKVILLVLFLAFAAGLCSANPPPEKDQNPGALDSVDKLERFIKDGQEKGYLPVHIIVEAPVGLTCPGRPYSRKETGLGFYSGCG